MRQPTFTELLESYNSALEAEGISIGSRLSKLQRASAIIRRHEYLEMHKLDNKIVAEYIREISDRFNEGRIAKKHASYMRREAEQFVQFVKTGNIPMSNPRLGARITLLPNFQKIVDDFLMSDAACIGAGGRTTSPNTRNDMRWVAHKYFEWLTEQGLTNLREVGAGQIQNFILYMLGNNGYGFCA